MEGIFITLIVFAAIYGMIKLIVQRKERIMLIDRMTSNVDPQSVNKLTAAYAKRGSFSTLTMGCLVLGIGMGFIVGIVLSQCAIFPRMEMISHDSDIYYQLRDISRMLYVASVLVFGGLGLIIAYLLEKAELRKSAKKERE